MRTISTEHWNEWPNHQVADSATSERSYNREFAQGALAHTAEKIGMIITYIGILTQDLEIISTGVILLGTGIRDIVCLNQRVLPERFRNEHSYTIELVNRITLHLMGLNLVTFYSANASS